MDKKIKKRILGGSILALVFGGIFVSLWIISKNFWMPLILYISSIIMAAVIIYALSLLDS